MTYNNEEIYNALKVISTTCEEASDCDVCPFSNSRGDCFFNEGDQFPNEWEIHPTTTWKPF